MPGKVAFIAAVCGAVGYAIGGNAGLIIGLCLGVIAVLAWRSPGHRIAFQRVRGFGSENPVPVSQPPPALLALMAPVAFGVPIFWLYDVAIALAHDSRSIAGWIETFQPAADWLAQFIPAFGRITAELDKYGQTDWVPAAQHVFAVGWLYFLTMTVWIAADVMIIHRRDWARMRITAGTGDPLKAALASFASLALMLLCLCWRPPLEHVGNGFGLGFDLSMLSLFFGVAVLVVWLLFVLWNAHLCRGLAREDNRQEQQLAQEVQGIMRDVLRGKPHER